MPTCHTSRSLNGEVTLTEASLAFFGGSGFAEMEGIEDSRTIIVDTPYGPPSSDITVGKFGDEQVAFLLRHGPGHRLSPSEVPVRANVYAMRLLGVHRIVSISAVGSLKKHMHPLDAVVPDQLIDRTKSRPSSFFEDGIVAHVGMADPYCPDLTAKLADSAEGETPTVHRGGAMVVIEGPQFSTRAESELYRSWGASIIGMTALPEARLAREAEVCYATLALVTDYDCWHDTEEDVSVEVVVENLHRNVAAAKRIAAKLITTLSGDRTCACESAMRGAIITSPDYIPDEIRGKLAPIAGRYLE